jgi:hypothetical protein
MKKKDLQLVILLPPMWTKTGASLSNSRRKTT